uniref:Uncharacterized protein n=1 Tax=Rhizophora mucronata TaxID=61149 RepID=A0A2P2PGR3_RHIMU
MMTEDILTLTYLNMTN